MYVSTLPIYQATNYAPVQPLLDLRETIDPKGSSITSQIRQMYEDLNSREQDVFESIAETAYTIGSFFQGKQIFQRNWFNGGRWELIPSPNINPNNVRAINKMQFQVSQMQEDLISSNPDFEPADMFKSWEYTEQVKMVKALWNSYERKFYQPHFLQQQALSLITAGTAIEDLVYDPASDEGIHIYNPIYGETSLRISEGEGVCYECGFEGDYEEFHSWEDSNDKKEYDEISKFAQEGDAEATQMLAEQPLASMPQCPNCGSFEVLAEPPQDEVVPTIIGLETYRYGDFCLHNRPIQMTRFDVSVKPENSDYFITNQYVPIRKIKHLLGENINLEEGDVGSDRCLDYLHKMSRIGASIGGARHDYGTRAGAKSVLVSKMSISPDLANEIELNDSDLELRTLEGGVLPKGKRLSIFSKGCTIIGLNGMQHIIGIYDKQHKYEVSSCVYFAKANSGIGRGAEDLTEIQKRVNRLDAQQVKAVEGATPSYAFVDGAVDQKDIKRMGFPDAKIPVKREFFNLTKDVSSFVKQFDPQQVAPQFFAYAQELEKMMQMTSHAVNLSDAVYGADNNTATGARILEATAQAIMIPMLQSKAEARRTTIKNLLYNYREVFKGVTRTFPLNTGAREASRVEVDPEQIDPYIEFVVVENSMIPQNYYIKRMDYNNFLVGIGGVEMIELMRQNNPALLSRLSKAYGVDIGTDISDQIEAICRMRLESGLDLLEQVEGLLEEMASEVAYQMTNPEMPVMPPEMAQTGDLGYEGASVAGETDPLVNMPPEELAPPSAPQEFVPAFQDPVELVFEMVFQQVTPPILPKEKDHHLKAQWFADLLDSPQGLRMTNEQRQLVAEFIIRHEEAQMSAMTAMGIQQSIAGALSQAPMAGAEASFNRLANEGEMATQETSSNGGASQSQGSQASGTSSGAGR